MHTLALASSRLASREPPIKCAHKPNRPVRVCTLCTGVRACMYIRARMTGRASDGAVRPNAQESSRRTTRRVHLCIILYSTRKAIARAKQTESAAANHVCVIYVYIRTHIT